MKNDGNPAKRLYNIVSKVNPSYQTFKNNGRVNPNNWQVWADVFEINIQGDFTLEKQLKIVERLNQSRNLVNEVEQILLKNNEIDHEKYLKPFTKLKELFPAPVRLSDSFTLTIDGVDLTILEFCIDAVAKIYREKTVDEEELKELLNQIRDLYEEIVDSEIDDTLKRILLDILKVMEDAIHEYRIRGIERLHEAVEHFIGIYIVNKEIIENSESEKVGRVRELIRKFGSLYSFAADSVQLLGSGETIRNTKEVITKLLGSGQ